MHAPSTWHYGLIADYWALSNLDAPELEIYEPHLTSPVLDAGCGAGRLLAPLREHGFDVDGCEPRRGEHRDVAEKMVETTAGATDDDNSARAFAARGDQREFEVGRVFVGWVPFDGCAVRHRVVDHGRVGRIEITDDEIDVQAQRGRQMDARIGGDDECVVG